MRLAHSLFADEGQGQPAGRVVRLPAAACLTRRLGVSPNRRPSSVAWTRPCAASPRPHQAAAANPAHSRSPDGRYESCGLSASVLRAISIPAANNEQANYDRVEA
jgi:hypothetical protein